MSRPAHQQQIATDHFSFQKNYIKDLTNGIIRIALDRVKEGWLPYQLSIMFNHLPLNGPLMLIFMMTDIACFHNLLMHHSHRHPQRRSATGHRPLLFAAPHIGGSVSGQSNRKVSGKDIRINDGLHYEAILLFHSGTRLKIPLEIDSLDRYRHSDSRIDRVHCQPIYDVPGAVDYVFKWLKWHPSEEDALILLP